MRDATAEAWVVYRMPVKGHPDGLRAVCERREWEELERGRPGYYTLVEAGLPNEGEAERLARGTSGADRPRNGRRQLLTWPGEATTVPAAPAGSRAD
jgi:hypothetical protein